MPGVNGVLSVVAALYWWGCAEKKLEELPSTGWLEAVGDVVWALDCLYMKKQRDVISN